MEGGGMKKRAWILVVLALLTLTALVVAACGGDDEETTTTAAGGTADTADGTETTGAGAPSGEEIVLGYAADLSGDGAVGDVPAQAGAEFAVEELNATGGIMGRPVRLVTKDMKGDPALGATVAQELLDEGAVLIFGPPFPGEAPGIIQTAAKENVAVLSPTATQPEYPVVGGSQAFIAAFGDNVQAAAAAEYALKQGYETAFIMVSPDLSYTGKGPEFFAEAFENGGGRLLGSETFSIGQQDFGPQVTNIAGLNPPPDVIHTMMFPPDVGVFVKQLRAAGVQTPVIGADGLDSQAFIDGAGADAEGTAFSTHGFPTPGSPFATFTDAMTAATGGPSEAPVFSALGADSVTLAKTAIENAGSDDPAEIMAALQDLENVELLTGTITYKGTNGVPLKTVTIAAVEGGAFVLKDQFIPSFIPEP
jgi:branched-chain amino acid transport system substrate-binding protein